MGPVLVVAEEPGIGGQAQFLRGHDQIGVEDLVAVGPVEPLDKGVLHGVAGLDVVTGQSRPGDSSRQRAGGQLLAVVAPESLGNVGRAQRVDRAPCTTRAAGIDVRTSPARRSRLPSSRTFKVRNRRPPYRGSCKTNNFVERFDRTVLDEFFRIKMGERFYASVEALQADLDAWLYPYNTKRPHLGYRDQGGRPIETINLFLDLVAAAALFHHLAKQRHVLEFAVHEP